MAYIAAQQAIAVGKASRKGLCEAWFAWALIAPALAFIAVIVAWPLIETIRLSVTDADMGSKHWVGLANYQKILSGPKFYPTLSLTFFWMVLSVSLKVIVGRIGASLLNAAVLGPALFRALIIPPWVIPIAIGCIGWLWHYIGQIGFLSGMSQRFGIITGPIEVLAYKNFGFYSAFVTDVWVGTPMVNLFFLATMQGVSRDQYEAAWTDGASRWSRLRRITIPQIMPVILSMALLSAVWRFNSFDIFWILAQSCPRVGTTTMLIDTCKTAIGNLKFGEGSTRAITIVVLLSLFSLLYMAPLNLMNKLYVVK